MLRKVSHLIIRFRIIIVVFVLCGTVFNIYQIKNVRFRHNLKDLVPLEHPYVKLHGLMERVFGGSNLVTIGLMVRQGDIFNFETLGKVKRITDKLATLNGVVPYRIVSISTKKLRHIYIVRDPRGRGYDTIMSVGYDAMIKELLEEKDVDKLLFFKKAVLGNRQVYGPLVSKDMKGTIIMADFWDEGEFQYIFNSINSILKEEEDDNTYFHVGGRPIMLAYFQLYMEKMLYLFILAVFVMLLLLLASFRTWRGILLPFVAGLMPVIWGLGSMGFWGNPLDMMNITVPFLILAIEVSHAVQIIKRYYEEFARWGDNRKACEETLNGLLLPGTTAIITDGAGFATLLLLPFRAIKSMALMASWSILRIFFTTLIFLPSLLAVLPPPKKAELQRASRAGMLDRILTSLAGLTFGRHNKIIIAFSALILIIGMMGSSRLTVGDVQKGSPYFWEDSKYNQDEHVLNEKFAGTNPYLIYIDAGEERGLYDPKIAHDVDALANHLRKRPDVGYVVSYVDFLKQMNRVWFDDDPSMEIPPPDRETIALYFMDIIGSVEPEVTRPYFELDLRQANIQVFLRDHRSETIKGIIKDTKDFLSKNMESDAKIKQAAGIIGLFAAIIEEIEKGQILSLTLISLVVFTFCCFTFRSISAGLGVLIPLGLGTIIVFAVMGFCKIGLFLSTVPVASMGMGLGVDYGIYILCRLRDELKEENEPKEAYRITMGASGKAVFFTAISVAFGVLILTLSNLRFQAILGGMLTVVVLSNMLGALLLLPSIVSFLKPRFIYGKSWNPKRKEGI